MYWTQSGPRILFLEVESDISRAVGTSNIDADSIGGEYQVAAQNNDKHIAVHSHTAHNTLRPVTCMQIVQFETLPPPATANAAHV